MEKDNIVLNTEICKKLLSIARVVVQVQPTIGNFSKSALIRKSPDIITEGFYTFEQLYRIRKKRNVLGDWFNECQNQTFPSPRLRPDVCKAIEEANIEGVQIIEGKVRFVCGSVVLFVGSDMFRQLRSISKLSYSGTKEEVKSFFIGLSRHD